MKGDIEVEAVFNEFGDAGEEVSLHEVDCGPILPVEDEGKFRIGQTISRLKSPEQPVYCPVTRVEGWNGRVLTLSTSIWRQKRE